MVKLEFSLNLPTEPEQLIKLSEDYKNLPEYLPDHGFFRSFIIFYFFQNYI